MKKAESKGLNAGSSLVRACRCVNPWADQVYGVGKRVHNVGKKEYTCTSCGSPELRPSGEGG